VVLFILSITLSQHFCIYSTGIEALAQPQTPSIDPPNANTRSPRPKDALHTAIDVSALRGSNERLDSSNNEAPVLQSDILLKTNGSKGSESENSQTVWTSGRQTCDLRDFDAFVELLGLKQFTNDDEIQTVFNHSVAQCGGQRELNFTECAQAVCELAMRAGVEEILPGHWGAVKPLPVSKVLEPVFANRNDLTAGSAGAWILIFWPATMQFSARIAKGRPWNAPCRAEGCRKLPSFGLCERGSPEFCRQHRPPVRPALLLSLPSLRHAVFRTLPESA